MFYLIQKIVISLKTLRKYSVLVHSKSTTIVYFSNLCTLFVYIVCKTSQQSQNSCGFFLDVPGKVSVKALQFAIATDEYEYVNTAQCMYLYVYLIGVKE